MDANRVEARGEQILHVEPPDLIFQSSKCGIEPMVLLNDTVGQATVELDMGYIE